MGPPLPLLGGNLDVLYSLQRILRTLSNQDGDASSFDADLDEDALSLVLGPDVPSVTS